MLADRYLKLALAITLLALLALVVASCEDFGQFPTPPLETKPAKVAPPTVITTADRAILAVYEHLLTLAQSAEAKTYLAEFYALGDEWKAEEELFQDGTKLWFVTIDMTRVKDEKIKPYWRQAGWFVYPDGKVIPSNRLKANALMIEADLQRLSVAPKP